VLSPGIFDAIDRTPPGKNGEVQLTDALRLLNESEPVYAATFEGKRYDLGNKLDWLKTNIDVALMRPEMRDELRAFMKEKLG
jgi:UTP--glucose-1-phosphate uridylyltransferase